MPLTKAQRAAELETAYRQGYNEGRKAEQQEWLKKDKNTAREAQINLVTAVGQMLHGLASTLDNGPR